MAINTASLLSKLNPISPIDLGGVAQAMGGAAQAGMERQRLQLAREQFEEAKRQNEREREWAKTEEAGRNARASMERQEALRKEEETRQATLLAQQQGGLQKFGELAGSGKVQQAEAMLPYLDQLGYDVNTLGNVGGLPVFQMQNRAQEAQKASEEFDKRVWHGSRPELEGGERPGYYGLARDIDTLDGSENAVQSLNRIDAEGMGYPTNERGTLDEATPGAAARGEVDFEPGGSLDEATADALTPGDADLATAGEFGSDDATVSVGRGMTPGSLSTGDAYAQALAASQYARDNKAPRRGPDEEDFQGAVPRNVIDLPAMAAETNARLSPMLKSIAGSLPTRELRDTAEAVGKGAAGLGLESTDALAEFKKGIDPALDIYKGEQTIAAAKAKDDRLTPVQEEQLKEMGIKRGNLSFKNGKVGQAVDVIKAADTVEGLMKEGGKRNHEKAVNYLMKMTGNVGSQTEGDALRVIGRGKLDSIEQLQDWLHERVVGGFSDEEIASINEFVAMQRESSTATVYGWLASNDQQMRNPKTHERTRAGYEEFRNGGSIPPGILDAYEERAKKAEAEGGGGPGQSAPQSSGEAGAELQRQAEKAGLNGQVLGRLMGGESGGSTSAASDKSSAKGVFQLIDSTAQLMGYKDSAEYAAQPLDKQIEVGLKLFQNKGITAESPPEDYALVLAAPSFVGKWKSRDDVVYKKDSDEWKGNAPWRPASGGDITVGSIADYYMGKGGKTAEAPPKTEAKADAAALPEPKTPAEKRYLELVKKRDN